MAASKPADPAMPLFAKASIRPAIVAWSTFAVALFLLTSSWWIYGTRFYDQVLPFYDSASYQEGYRTVANLSSQQGVGSTLTTVWKEPASNVVLYRFFAAVAGPCFPSPRTGLFVYLFGLHLLAALALCTTVRHITGQFLPAFAAVAVWFLTTPFGLLRDGVGDQRLDLSSGSAYLIVAALGLRWAHTPTRLNALLTGLAASLAALHRPILVPALAILGIALAITAILRHRRSLGEWLLIAGLSLAPIVLITLPWFYRHFEELRHYYFEYGPDVGTSVSWQTVARFNWSQYQSAFGPMAAIVLLIGLGLSGLTLHINPGRALLVVFLWAAPLLVLIAAKSTGNMYVQQASLGIPALLFAAWSARKVENRPMAVGSLTVGLLFLAVAVAAAPVRLAHALKHEPSTERQEVAHMLNEIATKSRGPLIAGFHDLPVSPTSMCIVARDLGLPFQVGTLSYYPADFGLSNDYLNDVSSATVARAVTERLAIIKQRDDLLLLPSADTVFRLWAGLYSHRLIPLIRTQIQGDPAFQPPYRVGPVKGVYFDVHRIKRNRELGN